MDKKRKGLIYRLRSSDCTYSLIYSYAKDAEIPILFAHYNHESTVSPYTTAVWDQNWCTIFITLSGNFSFITEGKIYSPVYGDVVIMREHEKYSSCFHSASHMDYYQINLPPEFFNSVPAAHKYSEIFHERPLSERNMISMDKSTFSAFMKTLEKLESTPGDNDILMYSYIIQILDSLCAAYNKSSDLFVPNKIPHILKKAVFYIHEHFLSISSVNEIAAACNISGIYMARIFKKHLNCTPSDYITNLRIAYAKQLLTNGETLTEVCFKAGFNNYTYFISKFKSIVGITPAKFRKEQL